MLRAFEFQTISNLEVYANGRSVDVCGIVAFVGPLETFNNKRE